MPARTAPRSRRAQRRRPRWVKWLKIIVCSLFLVIGIPAIILGFMFVGELNKASRLLDKVNETMGAIDSSKPSRIFSADGRVLYQVSKEYREVIPSMADVPKVVRDATLAAEDKRFYQHQGVDYVAMARMLLTNVREGRMAQGGSTLTMQLAKRITSKGEKQFRRKLQDIALAIQIEKRFTKDQILLLYLNQVYYGSGAYGVGAASQVYFGKPLNRLSIGEAAMLARIVRRPSKENPFDDMDAALRNRDTVLAIMRDEGMVTPEEYDAAVKERPKLRHRQFGSGAVTLAAPYFVQYVLDVFNREFPDVDLATGGYEIYTTLDSRIQSLAEHEVARVVRENRRRHVTTAAFVLMDADGRLLAMVGGVDFKRNQYNVVSQGHRQPGSAFKPFVYATALATGAIGPNDSISNEKFVVTDPVTGKTWSPDNSGGKYGGSRSVKSAIANSVNVIAVRVIDKTGPGTVVEYAHSVFGFKSRLDPVLSLALGSSAVSPLEMAQAYSVFMLGGDRATPFGISRVGGPDGNTIRTYDPNIARGVLSRSVCEDMDGFLRAVVTGGTASRYQRAMPKNSRGKTGTTSDNRDAWFCGYTDSLVGIGWIGNEHYDDAKKAWVYDPMTANTFGGTVTVQIWAGVVKKAEQWVGQWFQRSRLDETGPDAANSEPTVLAPESGVIVEPSLRPENPPPADLGPQPTAETAGGVVGTEVGPRTLVPEPGAATPGAVPPGPRAREPKLPAPAGTVPSRVAERPPPPKPATQWVDVEICADSGMRASMYCPETIGRRFQKGKAPTRLCAVHGVRR